MVEPPQIYEFGDFRIDAAKRLLLRGSETVPLTPKVFETLLYLVRRPGDLVQKDDLIRSVWPDTIVEENNLNQNISTLRRVLGETRGENRYIATIPGQGYRFVANVRRHAVSGPTASVAHSATRSLAVLPFKPLTADLRDEALELGMADTLIARLSSTRSTSVRPLSSVRKYGSLEQDALAAGRELMVESVLDGSIQRDGSHIRVTARLLQVSDGTSLWTRKFDEEFTDVFTVQDTISEKVAAALALRLSQEERRKLTHRNTQNIEAYHSYLKGRYHIGKVIRPAIAKGIEFFQQAIDADPTYALAYAGIADSYRRLPITSDVAPKDAFPKAKAAAIKALEIDPNISDAHLALGFCKLWFDWDWSGAEQEFQHAIELNPNNGEAHMGYAVMLTAVGRHDEAIIEGQRAIDADPLSLIVNANQAQFLHWARRDDEAGVQAHKTLELDPNFWVANLALARVQIQRAEYENAIAVLTKARDFSGGNSETISLIGYCCARTGDQPRARAVIDDLKTRFADRYLPPQSVAVIHCGLGDADGALDWLAKAHSERDVRLTFLKVDPKWDSIRTDPRFGTLLRQMYLG
ncbi:MAG: winged helix-turn-helix domain-containing protein [Acidobacteria bacterium]|nr:winged helix-turn-helix domain-containing protein [Acidobacteriota bacterium]